MTHTFTKRSFKGFTLIELLVVIAIIGLLSTIIAAPIQNARKKARDSKKVAEVKSVQLGLDQYAETNAGQYPKNMPMLSPSYMALLPSYAATTTTNVAPRDKFAYTQYVATDSGFSSAFAYHLGVHLESFSVALDNDRDCAVATNGSGYVANLSSLSTAAAASKAFASSTCAFYPLTGAVITGNYLLNGNNIGGMIPIDATANGYTTEVGSGVVSDYNGSDDNNTTCNAITDCVFDVTGQQ